MKLALLDLFHRHIATAFDHQLRLADWLAELAPGASWEYDVDTAELTFGGKLKYTAPLLGTFAEANNSWLWAWNNISLDLPSVGGRLAGRVRKLVFETACPLFLADTVVSGHRLFGRGLVEHTDHAMAAVVTRLLGYDAYYVMPYGGGRGVAVIKEKKLRQKPDQPLIVMCSRFTQLISALPIPDQKSAFLGYATDYGLTVTVTGGTIRAVLPRVGELNAMFDRKNRLKKLESQTGPEKPPGSKGPPRPRPKPKPRPK